MLDHLDSHLERKAITKILEYSCQYIHFPDQNRT